MDKNRSQVVYYDDVGDGASWTGLTRVVVCIDLKLLINTCRATFGSFGAPIPCNEEPYSHGEPIKSL